jgi:hypothetical protein
VSQLSHLTPSNRHAQSVFAYQQLVFNRKPLFGHRKVAGPAKKAGSRVMG